MTTTTSTITHTTVETPIGDLTLAASDGLLSGVYFPGHWTRPDRSGFGERDAATFAVAPAGGRRSSWRPPTAATPSSAASGS